MQDWHVAKLERQRLVYVTFMIKNPSIISLLFHPPYSRRQDYLPILSHSKLTPRLISPQLKATAPWLKSYQLLCGFHRSSVSAEDQFFLSLEFRVFECSCRSTRYVTYSPFLKSKVRECGRWLLHGHLIVIACGKATQCDEADRWRLTRLEDWWTKKLLHTETRITNYSVAQAFRIS